MANVSTARINAYERCVYSQNGEDGIIEFLTGAMGFLEGFFVEFGVGDATECNSRFLQEKGWKGLLLDSGFEDHKINLRKAFITAENICSLFEENSVEKKFEFLSVDIDGNEFYVLKEILDASYRPSIIAVEYNAIHDCTTDAVIPYSKNFVWDGSDYAGASLLALFRLAKAYGYSLVGTCGAGVNAFFVLDTELNKIKTCDEAVYNEVDTDILYSPPRYGNSAIDRFKTLGSLRNGPIGVSAHFLIYDKAGKRTDSPFGGGHRADSLLRDYVESNMGNQILLPAGMKRQA